MCRLVRGVEMGKTCACGEKTGRGGEALQAASLVVLDAENSSGKEEAAREAAMRHACK